MRRSAWISVVSASAISLGLGVGACSGGASSAGSGNGGDAGQDATTTSCTTDSQCSVTVPSTTPPSCATGKCNAVQGTCEYVAKDEDGDQHTAANCKSNSGVAVQAGDDCNDHDPNLYPGHPAPCTPTPEAGSDAGACTSGTISCQPNGSQSACSGVCTACVKSAPGCSGTQPQVCNVSGTGWQNTGAACSGKTPACLAGICVACTPGTTQCIDDAHVETCDSAGAWGAATACSDQACVLVSDAGAAGACTGFCAPTTTRCSGNGVETCNLSGGWDTPTTCADQTCVAGACSGVCAPGQSTCSGQQPQVCGANGQWQASGAACSAGTVCVTGSCLASACDDAGPPSWSDDGGTSCLAACAGMYPQGAQTFQQEELNACGCAAGQPCSAACSAACASACTSSTCNACLNAQVAERLSSSCTSTALGLCLQDSTCRPYAMCANTCP